MTDPELNRADRGKRRSLSQRVGKEGEALFVRWAVRRGLTANPTTDDFGIDFFCQVLKPVDAMASEESTGRIVGVQVKASESDPDFRIRLDRVDGADLLNQTQATCLVGICLVDNLVRFRFIDPQLIDSLLEFLASAEQTWSMSYNTMEADEEVFRKQLEHFTDPYVQSRLRLYLVRSRLSSSIPGAALSVHQSSTETVSHLSIPWIGSAFEIDPSTRDSVRVRVFDRGEAPPSVPGVQLKPEVLRALGKVGEGFGILSGRQQENEKLTVEYKDEHASVTFKVRHVDDEWAYVHPAGLRLVFSEARKDDTDTWTHELSFDLFPPMPRRAVRGPILKFLRLLRPGARLVLGRDLRVRVERFGKSLGRIGASVSAAVSVFTLLKRDSAEFCLVDLKDEEFGRALGFLDSFLLEGVRTESLIPQFVIGPMANLAPEDIPSEPAEITLPIVLNLKGEGIVVWVDCSGLVFMDGTQCCGFRIERQGDWRVQRTGVFKKSVFPEVWIDKHWPAIRIGELEPGVYSLPPDRRSEVTLQATIRGPAES
jgi:hypothetical protein